MVDGLAEVGLTQPAALNEELKACDVEFATVMPSPLELKENADPTLPNAVVVVAPEAVPLIVPTRSVAVLSP